MTELNIVKLIEENPVTKLSNNYQGKLLNKIKESFTDNQQQMFVASFYCYLNCNKNTDFIIDLDKVWGWMGFSHKDKAKRLLEKSFTLDIDYKCLLTPKGEQKKGTGRGGHNKEIIMMTVKTFKSLCLKADTKKADEIHEYYMKLEEILQELIEEEGNELREQLQQKDKLLENAQSEKELLREKTIIEQFPRNTQCVYYGIIDNVTLNNENLIKFGNSNFLGDRVKQHKKTYQNFRLVNAFKVENKLELENAIKKHNIISEKRRTITINNTCFTELIVRDGFSFPELDKIIKDIIISVEFTADNYKTLLKENDSINKEKKDLLTKILLLQEENIKLRTDNNKFIRKYKLKGLNEPLTNSFVEGSPNNNVNHPSNAFVDDITYNNITKSMKRIIKSPDGFYYIDNCKYQKCFGSRQEVWNGHAYKTTGELTKSDLIINKSGKIISKKKFIQEKEFNRFETVNLLKKNRSSD